MTTAKSIPEQLRELADTIERTLGIATHTTQTVTQRRNAEARNAEFATSVTYTLPVLNIARNHIVVVMSADLHSHHMQRIEAIADELENSFHYLSRYGFLRANAIQIESHGLGELLIQLLNRKGVTTQPLARQFEPFVYGLRQEETDASHAQQQHGDLRAPNQKQQPLGPK